jgi:hypothetical protein
VGRFRLAHRDGWIRTCGIEWPRWWFILHGCGDGGSRNAEVDSRKLKVERKRTRKKTTQRRRASRRAFEGAGLPRSKDVREEEVKKEQGKEKGTDFKACPFE